MVEFEATAVRVAGDDDAAVVVSLAGADADGRPRYLELALLTPQVRGETRFVVRAEVGRPRRVGRDCVSAAVLGPGSLAVEFAAGSELAAAGPVRATFALGRAAYRDLRRGLEEVFCGADLLRVVARG